MRTAHLLIKGQVQGVYYRASAQERANALSVTGWIKNTTGGNVEALISGSQDAVEEFISWCRKGPLKAEVTEVVVTEQDTASFNEFSIL